MLTLILLLASHVPPVPATTARTIDFASMTSTEAEALRNRRVRVRLVLDSTADIEDGITCYDALTRDATHRSVYFARGVEVDEDADSLIVERRLRVILHSWGLVEYRIIGARCVGTVK